MKKAAIILGGGAVAAGALLLNQSGVVSPPMYHRPFVWDYPVPMPAENVAFDLEASTNLTDWRLIVTTNQSPAWCDTPNATEYYRLGAHWITN